MISNGKRLVHDCDEFFWRFCTGCQLATYSIRTNMSGGCQLIGEILFFSKEEEEHKKALFHRKVKSVMANTIYIGNLDVKATGQ